MQPFSQAAVSLKSQVLKASAKRKFCRNHKNFDVDNFNKDFITEVRFFRKIGRTILFLRIPLSMI